MRDIKFRAWYANQEMHYGIAPIDNKYYIFFETQKRNAHDLQINRAISIMQYTGLKDENGKEIYEGDILDSRYNLPVTGQLIKKRYVVAQDKGYYIAQARKHPYGSTALSVIHADAKVVGNIYENPELMDDANN